MGTLFGGAFLIVIIILAVSIFLHFVPLGLWVSAISANVSVSIVSLIGMRLRRAALCCLSSRRIRRGLM